MKVVFTEPVYLQSCIRFVLRICRINVLVRSDECVLFMHLCGGFVTCIFHCKHLCICDVSVFLSVICEESPKIFDVLSTFTNTDKTGVF